MARTHAWLLWALAASTAPVVGCASDSAQFGDGPSTGSGAAEGGQLPSGGGGAGAGSGGASTGGGATGGGATGGGATGGSATGGGEQGGAAGQGPDCHGPADCNDDDACTTDSCPSGSCAHGAVAIDDADVCTVDSCDPSSGVAHVPIDPADANVCTLDGCDSSSGPFHLETLVLFEEDFSDNSAGWLLGNEWQIGPAQVSTGGEYGADPADDHSPSTDGGVAGVVIGGNANSAATHPMAFLVSPAFDTSGSSRRLMLQFWRWLVSDYAPYMTNQIDVFDGTSWVSLFISGDNPGINDAPPRGDGWTLVTFDVTDYANAAMRVRFGFDVGQLPVWDVGSWTIDDVAVVDTAIEADGDLCFAERCDGSLGTVYELVTTDDANACTNDGCDPARGVSHVPVTVGDNNVCTTDWCDSVSGVHHDPVDCDDGDNCTSDSCSSFWGCQNTPFVTPQPHDECVTGGPLVASECTEQCIADICLSYPSCCANGGSWTASCVRGVRTVCEQLVCPESAGSCAHTLCTTGAALVSGCDSAQANCVATICAVDSYCCTTEWDEQCIDEIASECGYSCT